MPMTSEATAGPSPVDDGAGAGCPVGNSNSLFDQPH
jgi:hypothetical protein